MIATKGGTFGHLPLCLYLSILPPFVPGLLKKPCGIWLKNFEEIICNDCFDCFLSNNSVFIQIYQNVFVSGKSHRLEIHVGFPKGQTAIKHHWTIVSMRFNIFQLNVFQCWFDTPFGNPVCQENFPLMFASHGCIYPLVISSMACWRILHLHLIFPAINLWLVRGFSS